MGEGGEAGKAPGPGHACLRGWEHVTLAACDLCLGLWRRQRPCLHPFPLGSTVGIESLGTEASRHLCAPLKLAPAGLPYHWVFGSLVGSL